MPAGLEILVIVIALLGFWAIVLRPARVQQRRLADLHADLTVGEEVLISAGIFGTVVELQDEKVRLEIAPGTVITVARQVVVRRLSEPEAAGPDDEIGQEHDDTAAPTSTTEDD